VPAKKIEDSKEIQEIVYTSGDDLLKLRVGAVVTETRKGKANKGKMKTICVKESDI